MAERFSVFRLTAVFIFLKMAYLQTNKGGKGMFFSKVEKFFKIKERKSSIRVEIIAGVTTFLAMAYILPVNSFMLAKTGMPVAAVFLATALSAAIATLIMGLVANFPVGLAAGMGVNAYFTFTLVLGQGVPWAEALAAVLVSGLIFVLISATGLRKIIINAIPQGLKYAIGAGIGFFIAFIGLKNAGIIVANPATFVALGDLSHPAVLLGVFGIILVVVLFALKNRFALIISIAVTAIIGLVLGALKVDFMPSYSASGMGDLGQISTTFGAAFKNIGKVMSSGTGWLAIFTFLFLDFFDTAGTLVAVGTPAGLINDKGELENADKALLADAIGTVAGATLGTSTVTSYIESGTGVQAGGRTGLTATVTGILFLLAIVAYPILSIFNGVVVGLDGFGDAIVYSPVTSMALVMVGIMMIGQLKNIDWSDDAILISGFFTIIFMILAYSISYGIAIGFIFYPIVMLCRKRGKEVHPAMYGLGVFFVIFFIVETLAKLS